MNSYDVVKYDSNGEQIELSQDAVKQYLVRGNGKVTNQEVVLFVNLCKAQHLNPFTNEVYLIKYGDSPAMAVVGYDTYKRRADDNPMHVSTESGIIVSRGNEIVQKPGSCTYPGESLIGGWCRVTRVRDCGGVLRDTQIYKEVSIREYSTGKNNWNSKPATMITKVAISQALREAYPKDFSGLYTSEEMDSTIEKSKQRGTARQAVEVPFDVTEEKIGRAEQETLFTLARQVYGEEKSLDFVRELLKHNNWAHTSDITVDVYKETVEALNDVVNSRCDNAVDCRYTDKEPEEAEPMDTSEPLPFEELPEQSDEERFDAL